MVGKGLFPVLHTVGGGGEVIPNVVGVVVFVSCIGRYG